jgi:hypothetical protein
MYYLNFRIIKLVVVWMQRFEICDFVCKKVCIKWECASSGSVHQVGIYVRLRRVTRKRGLFYSRPIAFACKSVSNLIAVAQNRQILRFRQLAKTLRPLILSNSG